MATTAGSIVKDELSKEDKITVVLCEMVSREITRIEKLISGLRRWTNIDVQPLNEAINSLYAILPALRKVNQ
jgi:hypothetical protein